MEFEFDKNTTEFLKIIAKNAQNLNFRVFFVGGIVRDKILNISTKDIDLLILGNAIEFSKTLPLDIKIQSIHEEFCTVKLSYNDIEIDIASSRIEKYPFSGCLPVLEEVGVCIEKDVLRRDFTVNSLYCEIMLVDNDLKYKFIDLVQGKEDINSKVLKVLHSKSYIDDPTRIIRGLGFKYRFGFDFSIDDKKLISDYIMNISYEKMSIDRNLKVISDVLKIESIDSIFKELIQNKYYKIINSKNLYIDFEFLFALVNDFNLSIEEKRSLYIKILQDCPCEVLSSNNLADVYKFFSKMSKVDICYYYFKTRDEKIFKFQQIKNIHIFTTGQDLLSLGYQQGINIGKILNTLFIEKLNKPEKFINKNKEIDWILKSFPKN